ncbi:MAG: FAD-dependent oxidoreductase, partial [Actinobacteria bacterium]|nr:FAD-dependent oxidoreductase [Actinomycetota bacterium]
MSGLDADVAVVGLGAIGSAALWRLADRGVDVIGFEQFPIGHRSGSSHGETRLFRTLTLEAPALVDVARRSQELLRELERSSGEELLRLSGGLMIGTPESDVISGVVRAAETHGVAVETIARAELA